MIVKNEEAVLGRALASAKGLGAEVIVVDTGSTDRTVEIAEAAGATVHHFTWVNDFSAARNHAFSKASGTWMMVLDADEELPEELKANVERVLTTSKASAIRIPVTAVDDRGAPRLTMPNARFVRNGFGYAYEGRVHEDVVANVVRAGGTIVDESSLPLVHHGYTSAESVRKDRRERNKVLLEAALEATPEDPRYWHYLGLELRALGDFSGATALFDRLLSKAPEHELAGWSASSLASIHEAERQAGAAWQVVQLGIGKRIAGIHCIVQLGQHALREGDADTATWCADLVERAPGDDFTERPRSLELAAELRMGAKVLRDPAGPKTRDALLGALQRHPRNMFFAEKLVLVCEAASGRGKGALDAMRRTESAPVVIGAAINALHRAGAFETCVELGETSRVHNETWAFALAQVGRREVAREELLAFGDESAAYQIVFGVAYDDEEVLDRGLSASAPACRQAMDAVRAGKKVARSLAWIVSGWVAQCVALREDAAARKLAAALPWTIGQRAAFAALVKYDTVDPIDALKLALEHPKEPDALEVMGLVAFAHRDWAGAADLLSLRASAGDAPVRVYALGAEALKKIGRRAEADAMIALGREARPGSKAFR